uniref:Uncharacterized protein n=1 Tax=viral metagenome TaxID=1070528 RepID=A0A6M3KRY3_9ZZZZ
MKRFSDFAEEAKPLDGEKIKIEKVLNLEIEVIGYKITNSKYENSNSRQCLTLQIEIDGDRRIVFTGSGVLIEQMEKYGDEVPFTAMIRKVDKYYTLA